jgi:Zn-dependent protease with chaperone function
MSTVQIRLHCTLVARMHVSRRAAYRCDLNAKLVTENPRVAKKRLVSVEGMDIGATDANPTHANQYFVRFQRSAGLISGE